MKDSGSLGGIYLQLFCPDFEPITLYQTGEVNQITQLVIEKLINVLKSSKAVAGIAPDQESIENWLLDFLREIHKERNHFFSDYQIAQLKSIANSSIKRESVFPWGEHWQTGTYVLSSYGPLPLYEYAPGRLGFMLPNGAPIRVLEKDKTNHQNIFSIFRGINITQDPKEIALSLLETADKHIKASIEHLEQIRIKEEQKQKLMLEQDKQELERKTRDNFCSLRKELNLPEAQLRESKKSRHRVTHCYNCDRYLESGLFLECSICGWLVCSCGACGCGYSTSYSVDSAD